MLGNGWEREKTAWKGLRSNSGAHHSGADSSGTVDDVNEENLEVRADEGEVVGELVPNDGSDGD